MARPVWLGLALALAFSSLEIQAAEPAPHAPGHVLIKFADRARQEVRDLDAPAGLSRLRQRLDLPQGASLRESAFTLLQRKSRRARRRPQEPASADVSRWMYLNLPPGLSVEQCVERLSGHPLVAYVEPDGVGTGGDLIPNDPDFSSQWHHRNNVRPGAEIGTPAAWDLTTGSSNIVVAVLDTGLNGSLAEFSARVVPGYDFVNNYNDPADDQGHGTWVTGTLAARGQNGVLGAGVDWHCRLMPVKVLDEENFGFYSDWAQGIDFAVANGAKVINLSAGGSSSSSTLEHAINRAIAAGVIFVTITHNDSNPVIRFPGNLPQCITVGATDIQDRKADFSNYGPQIDLVAPGQGIVTVNRFGALSTVNGTSFAAPLVAGVCALMAGINPGLTQDEASDLLTLNAQDQVGDANDVPGFDNYYGHGRLQAFNSVLAAYEGGTDLMLSQRESFEPASAGCDLVYTLTLTNRGGIVASNVVVTNILPSQVQLVSAASSQGTINSNSAVVVFNVGELAGRGQATLEVTVVPLQGGVLTNFASVSTSTPDPILEGNASSETTVAYLDEAGPTVVAAVARPDGNHVDIRFSEPVEAGAATNAGQYLLLDGATNVVLEQIMPGESPDAVVLWAELLSHPAPFVLIVRSQSDCLGNLTTANPPVFVVVPDFQLIAAGADWRYLDNGSDQGANWRNPEFDDGGWKTGSAPLGYGDGDEATTVDFGGNPNAKFITTYFRRAFTVPNAGLLDSLSLSLRRDDGAVVYLNGNELTRQNMPGGTISFSTLASSAVGGDEETEFFVETVDPAILRDGLNVLAVELHQSDPDSSDLGFDLELSARLTSLATPPRIVTPPQSQTVVQGEDVEFIVEVSGTPPLAYQWRRLPSTIVVPFGEGGPTLRLTNAQPTQAGFYLVTITNAVSASTGVSSAPAQLTVLSDRDGDGMPDAWELEQGFDPDDPEDAGWDADGDGATNLGEYRAGTDPLVSDLAVRIDAIAIAEGGIRLLFLAAPERSYSVLYRDSPLVGPWHKLSDIAAGPERTVEVVDLNPVSVQRFYRLVTPRQP